MSGLLLFPVLLLCLLGGIVIAAIWYFGSGKENRPGLAKVAAIPLGCAAIPVVGVVVLAAASNLVQKSDPELAEEVFGYPTTLSDDRTLFNDSGSGWQRAIYMRAEMTDAERRTLLALPGAVESDLTLERFAARGARQSFSWWIETQPDSSNYCAKARIRDAPGYNGWAEFRFAECLEAGSDFPQSSNKGEVYVIASSRSD